MKAPAVLISGSVDLSGPTGRFLHGRAAFAKEKQKDGHRQAVMETRLRSTITDSFLVACGLLTARDFEGERNPFGLCPCHLVQNHLRENT